VLFAGGLYIPVLDRTGPAHSRIKTQPRQDPELQDEPEREQ